MQALQDFLDNLPFPRWFVWTLLGVILVFAILPGGNPDVGYQIEKGIEARTRRVMRSLESLPVTDPGLRACIEAAARDRARIHPMNSGGIDDVRQIGKLYCPNRNIANLDGLGELVQLTYLEISGNRVESLAPLSNRRRKRPRRSLPPRRRLSSEITTAKTQSRHGRPRMRNSSAIPSTRS